MVFFVFFLFQLLTAPTQPDPAVLTVAAARAQGAGAVVTVRAVVLNGAELGYLRFVQDSKAGLAIFSRPDTRPAVVAGYEELQAGDSIQVTGTLKYFNGLLELDRLTALRKLASGRRVLPLRVPAAQAISLFSEAHEGQLIEITDIKQLAAEGHSVATLTANTTYRLNDLPEVAVRVMGGSTGPASLVGQALPTGEPFSLRGVLSKYAPGGGSGGYQLVPRLATDLRPGNGRARLTEAPIPVNLQPTSFTLVFATLNPGDTRVRYGLSAQDLKYSCTDLTLTTQHRISLSDLIAGATYYVEVSSRNDAGTETAPAVPVILGGPGKRGRSGR